MLYLSISNASTKFSQPAFNTNYTTSVSNSVINVSCVNLDEVACPSFGGNNYSSIPSIGTTPPTVPPSYSAVIVSPALGVGITNYVALSPRTSNAWARRPQSPPRTRRTACSFHRSPVRLPYGLNMKSVLDGTSKTLIVCETKEQCINSWYDGTVAWTVAYNPNSSIPSKGMVAPVTGFWIAPVGGTSALNVGPRPATPGTVYLTSSTVSPGLPTFTGPWQWGPSSDHSGGVVIHLACDASVHSITEDIDPSLYMQLVTRAGGEPVVIPDVL